jgi:hypothetical protein
MYGNVSMSPVITECALTKRICGGLLAIGQPQRDLANSLIDPGQVSAPRWRPVLLAVLVVMCLVPRLWMAARLPSICPDAVVYFRAAEALNRGDLRTAMGEMRLNTLPVALAGLHRLGLSYEQAGLVWGLLMSTAAVLPLFGWLRQQFDDRVAAVACCLYAVHPGLIERSPEVIREPTFWFVLLMGLYASWRAASEGRIGLYLLAGLCIVLAVLTRIEGALLVIPLTWWTLTKVVTQRGSIRYRWLAKLACALAMGPALLLLIQFTILPQAKVSSLVRVDPLVRAEAWLSAWGKEDVVLTPLTVGRRIGPGIRGMLREFVLVVGRGIEPVLALLLVSSLVGWTSLWKRRDIVPLLLVALLVFVATWIHLWYAREGSSRYVLTASIVFSPLAALGLLWPQARREILPGKLATNCLVQGVTAVVLLAALSVYGCMDAVMSNFDTRAADAELGRWIAHHFGPDHSFAGPPRASALVAYYANSRFQELPPTLTDKQRLELIERGQPEVVLVQKEQQALGDLLDFQCDRWGLEEIDPRFFPEGNAHRTRLFVRRTGFASESGRTVAASAITRH